MSGIPSRPLRSVEAIRQFFAELDTELCFVNPTNFNLYGAEEWLPRLRHVVAVDGYDGRNPHVVPARPGRAGGYGDLEIAEVNDWLLEHPAVRELLRGIDRPKALLMMFNARTEELAAELGLEICFPPAAMRDALDDKLGTVRLGDRAGVPSVPNVLASARSYGELRANAGDLGPDLVVQAPFGYSGHSTYFISDEADWARHGTAIAAEAQVKIMRRIRPLSTAIEGCATAQGVIVGPLMTELIGHPSLTPYPGGWCGNELVAGVFSAEIVRQARRCVERLGAQLYREGYRGYFELDLLVDLDDGSVYLGELNPRLSGASPMTNLGAFARANVPLYLFHLLEWFGVPFELDIDALNDGWSQPVAQDDWSQLIIGHTDAAAAAPAAPPPSGIWALDEDGCARPVRPDLDREAVVGDREAFFVRTVGPGDQLATGTVVGRLMLRGRAMTTDGELTATAAAWTAGIKSAFAAGASASP